MAVESHLQREARRLYRLADERAEQAAEARANAVKWEREADTLLRKAKEHEAAASAVKSRF